MSDEIIQGPGSVLEAIRRGDWEFEPEQACEANFDSTNAMPGTKSKVHVLAQRAREGLPLWHSCDCCDLDDLREGA